MITTTKGRASSPLDEGRELLTTNEVAAVLSCSTRFVERVRRDGRLPAIRLGKVYRYRRDDVLHVLAHGIPELSEHEAAG